MMAADMKIIKFYLGDKDLKYEFPFNSDSSLIDQTLREYFNISEDSEYYLFDMQDSTLINISSLHHLNNESKISIKIKNTENSLTSTYSNTA